MVKKLNSMRLLEAQGVRHEVLSFPETIHSAVGVAAYYGLPPAQVYKTLVVVLSQGKPALVLIAGDREIQLKRLAQALGEKKPRMATQKEAEAWTGLRVGGISALALCHRSFPVYIDRAAAALDEIIVSAGQRGMDIRLAVADLVRITRATFVEATTFSGEPRSTYASARDLTAEESIEYHAVLACFCRLSLRTEGIGVRHNMLCSCAACWC